VATPQATASARAGRSYPHDGRRGEHRDRRPADPQLRHQEHAEQNRHDGAEALGDELEPLLAGGEQREARVSGGQREGKHPDQQGEQIAARSEPIAVYDQADRGGEQAPDQADESAEPARQPERDADRALEARLSALGGAHQRGVDVEEVQEHEAAEAEQDAVGGAEEGDLVGGEQARDDQRRSELVDGPHQLADADRSGLGEEAEEGPRIEARPEIANVLPADADEIAGHHQGGADLDRADPQHVRGRPHEDHHAEREGHHVDQLGGADEADQIEALQEPVELPGRGEQ
jgi:hypothetical protein